MNLYSKARRLLMLMEVKERINELVDPDVSLLAQLDAEIAKLGKRKEEVDEETGEIR